ncbi:mitochondrial import receptor subunit TOM6 homolog [Pezoporus occidentalis]
MAGAAAAASAAAPAPGGPGAAPQGLGGWLRSAYRFATDRNDFRRNLLVNLGLFAAGVWVARNLTDIDLMAPQPVP